MVLYSRYIATIASTVVTGVAVAVMDQAVRRTPALSVRSHCPFIGRLVKKTLAEKASGSSKKRKVEPPDEPPAPEPDEATVEIGRNEMAALMHATADLHIAEFYSATAGLT